MRVLIAGGRGFLGSTLSALLGAKGHTVLVLTRASVPGSEFVRWDGKNLGPWVREVEEADVVVNACGFGLEHWPWLPPRKRQFERSRVEPGLALARAIAEARQKPSTLVQFSGINRYGLAGDDAAIEETPAANDFMAHLTVAWEDATQAVESMGVRRVIVRNAVVLDRGNGLFPLMCLPARLWMGGRLGAGRNAMPWIHVWDHMRALLFLIEAEELSGAFNLVAPVPASSAELLGAVCRTLHRPFWFHVPGALIRLGLGEMADMLLRGRASKPQRLQEAGFAFEFADIRAAVHDLLGSAPMRIG